MLIIFTFCQLCLEYNNKLFLLLKNKTPSMSTPHEVVYLILLITTLTLYAICTEYDRVEGQRSEPNKNFQTVSTALLVIVVLGCCRLNGAAMSNCVGSPSATARMLFLTFIILALLAHCVFGIAIGAHTGNRSEWWFSEEVSYAAIVGSSTVAVLAFAVLVNRLLKYKFLNTSWLRGIKEYDEIEQTS